MGFPRTSKSQKAVLVHTANKVAGTPGGSRVSVAVPTRGYLYEAGFIPWSLVASAMTMQVAIGANATNINSATSSFTTAITSTTGTFSSTNLFEGAIASVSVDVTLASTALNRGDVIQFTTSGGDTSAIGATFYAVIGRA